MGVHFLNANAGWIVMKDGTSLITTNGGKTWKQRRGQLDVRMRLQAVKFRNHSYAWAVANDSILPTTENQGESWQAFPLENDTAATEKEIWHQRMAADVFNTPLKLTNAHILEDGQGWAVGAFASRPRTSDDFRIDAGSDEKPQESTGLIYNTTDAGKNWYQQLGEQPHTFWDVLFLDQNNGWIAGDNGTLMATEDAGKTWHPLTTDSRETIIDTHFVSLQPKWGWAMTREGTLLYTTNGTTWTRGADTTTEMHAALPGRFALNDVAFGDFSEGWAVGKNGTILHNTDGGTIWKRQRTSTGKTLNSIDMKFAPLGWTVGTNGVLQRTVNGGEYWKFHETHSGYHLHAVAFINQRKGWAAGHAGIILSTTDGGFTWRSQDTGVSKTLFDVFPLSEDELYAVGASGTIIYSTDAGETWQQEHTGVENALYAITGVKDSDTLWVVGQSGVLLRRNAPKNDD